MNNRMAVRGRCSGPAERDRVLVTRNDGTDSPVEPDSTLRDEVVFGAKDSELGGIDPLLRRTRLHYDYGQTTTTSSTNARLGSPTPPLAALVVRLAQSELSLANTQIERVDALVRETDGVIRPIDDARTVFLETLARGVEQDHLSSTQVRATADEVVRATEEASPALTSAILRLVATLSPRQRVELVKIVHRRAPLWSPFWEATKARESIAEVRTHGWIDSLANSTFGELADAIQPDAVATARAWTERIHATVNAKVGTLDAMARRSLASRLRADAQLD